MFNEIATRETKPATPTKVTNTSIPFDDSSMHEIGQDTGGLQTGRVVENTRQNFLRQIGLKWDPFIMPVSEQELAFSGLSPQDQSSELSAQEVSSLAYFIPPQNPADPERPFLFALRQPATAFIFGKPGSGKTSLRLWIEANCRRVPDKSLVVSYLFGQDVEEVLTTEDHQLRLSQQLAVDAFIQIIEQFKPGIDVPGKEQHAALSTLMTLGGRSLQRLAARLITEPEPASRLGLAERWRSVGRLPVYHVAQSPELLALLQCAMNKTPGPASKSGRAALSAGWAAAKEWGFEKALVLVDGVDTWRREPERMLALIMPLLQQTVTWQAERLFCKYFLPENLRAPVKAFIDQHAGQLTLEPFIAELTWNRDALCRLLAKRFQAAGARRTGLGDLAERELAEQLDELLLAASQGSPRRLLQLVSTLIDVHVQANFKEGGEIARLHLFAQEEWRQTVTRVTRQFD